MIEEAGKSDDDALGQVMFDAVRSGPSPYDEAQRAAWVPVARSGPEWTARLARQFVVLERRADMIPGFMSLDGPDYIDFAYIRLAFRGTGLFRRLFRALRRHAEARGAASLTVHASLSAAPAFAAMGFAAVREETVAIGDQSSRRFAMTMPLETAQ